MYVPRFNYNLLSMSKLTKTSSLSLIFFPTCCIVQGPLIKIVVAVGREEAGLYKLDQINFLPTKINKCLFEVVNATLACYVILCKYHAF